MLSRTCGQGVRFIFAGVISNGAGAELKKNWLLFMDHSSGAELLISKNPFPQDQHRCQCPMHQSRNTATSTIHTAEIVHLRASESPHIHAIFIEVVFVIVVNARSPTLNIDLSTFSVVCEKLVFFGALCFRKAAAAVTPLGS